MVACFGLTEGGYPLQRFPRSRLVERNNRLSAFDLYQKSAAFAPASRSGIAALSCARTRSRGRQSLPAPDATRLAISYSKWMALGCAERAASWTIVADMSTAQFEGLPACFGCAAGSGPSFAHLDRCRIGRAAASATSSLLLRRSARLKPILSHILVASTAT